MKFHITITNNETGKTILDVDANAILASIHTEESTGAIVLTDCNLKDLSETIAGLFRMTDTIEERECLAFMLAKVMEDKAMTEEIEENTEE